MTLEEFEDHVDEALDSLPDEILDLMDNIEVQVVDRPTREQAASVALDDGELLLGLYVGVPLDRRDTHYGNVLPDRVLIFRRNIEAAYDPDDLVDGIRRTVLHEVGHHFGLTDDRLHDLGY
ncbi:MAG TPA: metallopeptidase family protein [Phycisphaerae bacterium]|nr:metallopeptidase family protein [Phycisphaerae bacterium]HOI53877.1 metallopeptidase family protein [Phycisphaerae bacterium]